MVDREAFEPRATKSKADPSWQLFGLEYEVLKELFLVSDSRIMGGVEKRYFYLAAFVYGLRFLLSNFVMEVLKAYNVARS